MPNMIKQPRIGVKQQMQKSINPVRSSVRKPSTRGNTGISARPLVTSRRTGNTQALPARKPRVNGVGIKPRRVVK